MWLFQSPFGRRKKKKNKAKTKTEIKYYPRTEYITRTITQIEFVPKIEYVTNTEYVKTTEYVSHTEHITKTVEVPAKEYVEVLFFPDSRMPCDSFYERLKGEKSKCQFRDKCTSIHYNQISSVKSSLVKILLALSEAKSSIDLCMFAFTFQPLADFLIHLKRNGVAIRVIADGKSEQNDQLNRLQEARIALKSNGSSSGGSFVHNKFVIVDQKLVVHGSLNWTLSGISKNKEACVIDSGPNSARAFVGEFEKLWANMHHRKSGEKAAPKAEIRTSKSKKIHKLVIKDGWIYDYVVEENEERLANKKKVGS